MPQRQQTTARSGNNLPVALSPYGQFVTPEDQGFLGRTLNAFGYMNALQTAGHDAAGKGMNPYTAGLAAILQRKNIRDTGKAYARQEQAKRQERARFGNMGIPQDVIDQMNAQQGIPAGQPLFNGETYLDEATMGNIQYNLGNYRQQNMGKLPVYGVLSPSSQTGPSVRGNLQQRGKVANFDYAQQQFGNDPFQAGQQGSGIQTPVPVGNGQTMYMQGGLGSIGRANQVNDGPVHPGAKNILQGGVQQQGAQPLAGGVNQASVQVQDVDPYMMPSDYPAQTAGLYKAGAQDAQRTHQNQTNRQRVDNQWQVQQTQIKKLEEETRWLGPKAKAYIQNATRPRGGSSRMPSKLEIADQMYRNGDITQKEYQEARRRYIGIGKTSKPKAVTPGTLDTLGDLKGKYDEAGGFFGIGGDPAMQDFYRNTYNGIADQNGLPKLPAKGGKASGRMGKQDFLNAAGGGRR